MSNNSKRNLTENIKRNITWISGFIGNHCRCLEIGVYRGETSRWLLDTILTHPDSRWVGIDPFGESSEAEARRNIGNDPRARLIVGRSQEVMRRKEETLGDFDLIYVDGDHSHEGAKTDIVQAWPLLSVGGVMVIDDVRHPHYPGIRRAAVEFLSGRSDWELVGINHQMGISKISEIR